MSQECLLCQKILEFYQKLLTLMEYHEFHEDEAKKLVILFEETKDEARYYFSPPRFDVEIARCLFKKFEREEYAEYAFEDLAPYLKAPEAQRVVNRYLEHTEELFMQVANRRLLNPGDKYGPAVVTIVVSSYDVFQNIVSACVAPTTVHGSYGEKVTPI